MAEPPSYNSIEAYGKVNWLKRLWRRVKMTRCPWCQKEIEIKSQTTVKKVADKKKTKLKKLGDNIKAKK